MVRLLSVEQFGEYREFLLYGTIILMVVGFCINSSLAYFVPREPDRERLYFTQATVFVLCTSVIAAVIVLLFGEYFPSTVIREHKYALCLYILFQANLDAWEVFWIAKKQTINVLYYSLMRLGARMTLVVLAAYLTRDVDTIIRVLVLFEAIRLITMWAYARYKKLLTSEIDVDAAAAQFKFFYPLGVGNIIYSANLYMGQLFISAVMGPAMLAIYTIGTYLNPLIRLFRSSIGDVIMPEIASMTDVAPKVALVLWQRVTVIYCVIMLPIAVLFYYYADVFVTVFFTAAYADAIPVLQVFVFLLVRECFDFALPLRIVNRTIVFMHISLLTLILNLGLMLVLFKIYGLLGPALAMVISRSLVSIVFAAYVMKYCEYSLAELLPWTELAKVTVLCLVCIPVLILGDLFNIAVFWRAVLFGGLYVLLYTSLLTTLRISEVNDFLSMMLSRANIGSGQR